MTREGLLIFAASMRRADANALPSDLQNYVRSVSKGLDALDAQENPELIRRGYALAERFLGVPYGEVEHDRALNEMALRESFADLVMTAVDSHWYRVNKGKTQ